MSDNPHVVIVAGTVDQARQYKHALGLESARVIVSEHDILGTRLDEIHYCGTYYNRPDWHRITDNLDSHRNLNCKVFYHHEVPK